MQEITIRDLRPGVPPLPSITVLVVGSSGALRLETLGEARSHCMEEGIRPRARGRHSARGSGRPAPR